MTPVALGLEVAEVERVLKTDLDAGNATGDATTVTVTIYSGSNTSGAVVQTLTATRTGSSYSVNAATLADGAVVAPTDSASSLACCGSREVITSW